MTHLDPRRCPACSGPLPPGEDRSTCSWCDLVLDSPPPPSPRQERPTRLWSHLSPWLSGSAAALALAGVVAVSAMPAVYEEVDDELGVILAVAGLLLVTGAAMLGLGGLCTGVVAARVKPRSRGAVAGLCLGVMPVLSWLPVTGAALLTLAAYA